MMLSVTYISTFVTLLLVLRVDSYQSDIGSGDDGVIDNEVPHVKWDTPNYPGTGSNGGKDQTVHGPDNSWRAENAWNRRPPGNDNEWDIDETEGGSGGDQEVFERIPGVHEPPRSDEDDIGGGGLIIDPIDPREQCIIEDYCRNAGSCYYDVRAGKSLCQCAQGFTGVQCEIEDWIIRNNEDNDEEILEVQKSTLLMDIISHPIAIAVMAVSGLLFIALLITLLICCCRCIRKKDEGSYALDAALHNQKVEYTKVPNSQEFYA